MNYDIISVNILVFKIQGIGWYLSMMRINYKLTKRTKTEEIEKSLKMYNIIHFKTIRYKRSASGITNSFNPQLQASETG